MYLSYKLIPFFVVFLISLSISEANIKNKGKNNKRVYKVGDTQDKVVLKRETVDLKGTIVTVNPVNQDVTGYRVKLIGTKGSKPKVTFAKGEGNHLVIYSKDKLKGSAIVDHLGIKSDVASEEEIHISPSNEEKVMIIEDRNGVKYLQYSSPKKESKKEIVLEKPDKEMVIVPKH